VVLINALFPEKIARNRIKSYWNAAPRPGRREQRPPCFRNSILSENFVDRIPSRADFIVTGNMRDFPDVPYGPTLVVSSGELLDRISLEM
jgi:hypothetical protein